MYSISTPKHMAADATPSPVLGKSLCPTPPLWHDPYAALPTHWATQTLASTLHVPLLVVVSNEPLTHPVQLVFFTQATSFMPVHSRV